MTPFSWRSLLDLADRLLAEGSDEAVARTVINRAYYAAFNVARDFVEQSEQIPNLGVHKRVWQWFVNHESGRMLTWGHLGFRLLTLRNQADYMADAGLSVTDAQRAVHEARLLIDAVVGMNQRP